ncbi:MAG: hypothetical protein ACYDIC_10435 [Desulfobaccales bacterium]
MQTLRFRHPAPAFLSRAFSLRRLSFICPPCFLAVFLTALLLFGPACPAGADAGISVDAAQVQGYINPLLFGHNVLFDGNTMWDQTQDTLKADADDRGVNVQSRINDLAPTVLRFPGGEASDLYMWEDGLGLQTKEAVSDNATAISLAEPPQSWSAGKGLLIDPGAGKLPLENLSGQLGDSLEFTGIDLAKNQLTGVSIISAAHAAGAAVRPGGRPLGNLPGEISQDYWTNTYGIIEHLKLANSLGAQPLITVNFSTGLDATGSISTQVSLDQRIMRAQALVAFCNGTANNTSLGIDGEGRDWRTVGYWAGKRWQDAQGQPVPPLGVKYWEVGNEPCFVSDPGLTTAKDYAAKFNIFASKMKAVDPFISVGAVGLNLPTWYGEAPDDPDPWNETVIKGTQNDLDFLIVHSYYPAIQSSMDFTGDAWFKLVMAGATQAWKHLTEIRDIIDANTPGREVGLAVTEYGFLIPVADARLYSNLARALYEADILMYLVKGARQLGLVAAAAWNLHGANANAAIGYQWPDTWTASGSRTIRPQYYAQKMLRQNLISRQLVKTEVSSSPTFSIEAKVGNIDPNPAVPCLEALAALSASGRRLSLVVINRSLDSAITAAIQLNNLAFTPRTALVTKLTSPRLSDHNEDGEIVAPSVTYISAPQTYNFEPHSLTILEYRKAPVAGLINLLLN